MRKLILMRGVPCCGKTTLINKLSLDSNTLSPDNLRLMISGLELSENGIGISQKDNVKIFKRLFEIIEDRMECGLLTIIDSCHITERQIERYRFLCKKYNYECVVVDFKVEIDELIERNKNRGYRSLPEDTIQQMYKEKLLNKIPSFCKKIKPEQLENEVQFKFSDTSKYKKIVHIGDIHGCATVLKEAISNFRFDSLYIFHGDYIDRGIQNVETLKFLISLMKKPNIIFLKGNHEINLIKYANGEETYGKSFEKTKTELEESDINLKDLKEFCNKLVNYFAYSFQGKKVFCSHGGISNLTNINLISEHSFVVGSGSFDINIDKIWENNVSNIYQVHGHRNHDNLPIMASSNSFNLEGSVETGGYLRILEVSDNFHIRTYKNMVYAKEAETELDEIKKLEQIEAAN